MIICPVCETLRTLQMWKWESIHQELQDAQTPSTALFHSQMIWAPISHPSSQCFLLTSLLLPWAWWTSVPLWDDLSKMCLFNPMTSRFPVTFSSAFTQPPTLMLTAWLSSFFKTVHLQNLFIQPFHSLASASSPRWFRLYHHNCVLTSPEPQPALTPSISSLLSLFPLLSNFHSWGHLSNQALPCIPNVFFPLSFCYSDRAK